jgi:hypothetical protein
MAITNHNTLILYITDFGKVELINNSVNKTGDESKAFSDSVGNTYFYFRVSNVVGMMHIYVNDSYSFAFDLAKIVEQRIYNSMS